MSRDLLIKRIELQDELIDNMEQRIGLLLEMVADLNKKLDLIEKLKKGE